MYFEHHYFIDRRRDIIIYSSVSSSMTLSTTYGTKYPTPLLTINEVNFFVMCSNYFIGVKKIEGSKMTTFVVCRDTMSLPGQF
jgi:hypothetical protein